MIYRHAAYVFLALMTANGVAVEARPDSERNVGMHQIETDLTGYWQQGDGQVFYFTQEGSSLTSRHSRKSASHVENEVDFTATIHGNLIYGAHRGPYSRAMQEKCSRQIWVGMGLTLNEGRNELTGFRGDRIVDPENCSAKNSDPVAVVYTRIADAERLK